MNLPRLRALSLPVGLCLLACSGNPELDQPAKPPKAPEELLTMDKPPPPDKLDEVKQELEQADAPADDDVAPDGEDAKAAPNGADAAQGADQPAPDQPTGQNDETGADSAEDAPPAPESDDGQ